MKIINFIICDDIRSEIGNKKSLMGIYTKTLSFSVNADEKDNWPKELSLGMMLEFSISQKIKRAAHKFKVFYSINSVEKVLGEGEFNFPRDDQEQEDDFKITLFSKSKYHFESCGNLKHCVKIFDISGKVIARAIPDSEFVIRENIIESKI